MHVNSLTRGTSPQSRVGNAPFKPATIRWMALFSADLSALVLAAVAALMAHMSFEVVSLDRALGQIPSQGFSWHGWGSILVAGLLVGYFGCRGHYTLRVPIWTELRGLAAGVAIGFLCDSYIRVMVYGSHLGFESVGRWILLLPCLILMRKLARTVLDDFGVWRLRTLIIGDDAALKSTRAAFPVGRPARLRSRGVGRITCGQPRPGPWDVAAGAARCGVRGHRDKGRHLRRGRALRRRPVARARAVRARAGHRRAAGQCVQQPVLLHPRRDPAGLRQQSRAPGQPLRQGAVRPGGCAVPAGGPVAVVPGARPGGPRRRRPGAVRPSARRRERALVPLFQVPVDGHERGRGAAAGAQDRSAGQGTMAGDAQAARTIPASPRLAGCFARRASTSCRNCSTSSAAR